MEEKLTYAEFSSQLNDKNIVILEFGHNYTRCGFAGESLPRAIIKTSFKNNQGQEIFLHTLTNDPEQLRIQLFNFVERLYFHHLAVSPKERKVVIVESVFCKSLFRNTLTRIFFEQFDVPAILFVPDHLMALATLGQFTGLIVDMGAEEVISIAVVDGITLLDISQFTSLGAKTLDSLIYQELVKIHPDMKDQLKPDLVEDIRVKSCFVAPFERGVKITIDKSKKSRQIESEKIQLAQKENKLVSIGNMEGCYFLAEQDDHSPDNLDYHIRGYDTIKIPGNLREGACEIFFEIYAHEHSLTTMIIETILSAPIDCRKALASNILIIGGLANLPGLEHRLSEELKNIHKYQLYRGKIPDEFKFHKPICPRNYVSWLGASMFCTPSTLEMRSTTRDQWLRDGKKNLREWSDLIR